MLDESNATNSISNVCGKKSTSNKKCNNMNINLSKASLSTDKKKQSNLFMGLNVRSDGATGCRPKVTKSVFGGVDDDDDDNDIDDDDRNISGREAVNRSIAKQQATIRAQAAAFASTSSMDASIYDYDGVYDSMHTDTNHKQHNNDSGTTTTTANSDTSNKKSRYIEDLMKTAKVRKMERDIAYDRKIVRDQRIEAEIEPEYRNKEKFITSSYQREISERQQYQQQELIRQQIDDNNDVTKRNDIDGKLGMTRLYGKLLEEQSPSTNTNNNINYNDKNITKQREQQQQSQSTNDTIGNERKESQATGEMSMAATTTTVDGNNGNASNRHRHQHITDTTPATGSGNNNNDSIEIQQQRAKRLLREEKLKAARDRYFQRHIII